jgi:putative GTP pyrophosphokinase
MAVAKSQTDSEQKASSSSSDETHLTASQVATIKSAYATSQSHYKALTDEVVFILEDRIKSNGIKIHGVENRVKDINSIIQKCRAKGIDDISKIVDVAGARVICLFRSDIEGVGKIISDNFDVVGVDDKRAGDSSPLGYVSVHYVCTMPPRYKGPRYDNVMEIKFEIQVRTLCMHAWAAVSHYLEYKGEWDVPGDLKRSLNALGGLFYVADSEFEQFYSASLASRRGAASLAEAAETPDEINLDTVRAFIDKAYPDRDGGSDEAFSRLVREIKEAGYVSLKVVAADIKRAKKAFERYEDEHPPHNEIGRKYLQIGVARLSLALASPDYYEVLKRGGTRGADRDELLKYRKYLKP